MKILNRNNFEENIKMEPMRILYVTSEIPYPPDNGVRIVSYNAMRLMKIAGHKLALAVLSDETWDIESRLNHMREICQYVEFTSLHPKSKQTLLLKILCGELYFMERYHDHRFQDRLKHLIEQFQPDCIHFDTILMTQYHHLAPDGVRTVASINDCYSLDLRDAICANQYRGLAFWYRKWQLINSHRFEARTYSFFDAVHVMSAVDAKYLKELNSDISLEIISNGVSEELFSLPMPDFDIPNIVVVAHWGGSNLIYLHKFLLESWQLVRKAFPCAILSVVGKLPQEARSVQKIGEQLGNVRFKGYLKEISDVYCDSCMAIVPVRKSCGIINKAVEAMAAGKCVVGFRNAFIGIPQALDQVHYISTQDYEGFVKTIIELLSCPQQMEKIGANARSLIQEEYSWNSRITKYEKLYSS